MNRAIPLHDQVLAAISLEAREIASLAQHQVRVTARSLGVHELTGADFDRIGVAMSLIIEAAILEAKDREPAPATVHDFLRRARAVGGDQ
jgi:hypothetical protein